MQIEFDHFTIRPLQEKDAEQFCTFILKNKERIASSAPVTVRSVTDAESAHAFIRNRIEMAGRMELLSFTLFDNNTSLPVANLVIMHIDTSIPKGELGYFIDGDYEGVGIITKFVGQVCNYAFDSLGFNKLYMRISEVNASSKRVAEKNGFEKEGLLRKDFRNFENELVDVIYYGKTRE